MCRLVESIKAENKTLYNIRFHNERFNRTRAELFSLTELVDLTDVIKFPDDIDSGLYKCRVVYDTEIIKIEFVAYRPRLIKALKAVNGDYVKYDYKYCDRDALLNLKKSADCSNDEEILIIKNGRPTDTSYSNVVFYDGGKWLTPAQPLLKGTTRARLLEEGIISVEDINASDIKKFRGVKLINAMIDFEKQPLIPSVNIILG